MPKSAPCKALLYDRHKINLLADTSWKLKDFLAEVWYNELHVTYYSSINWPITVQSEVGVSCQYLGVT